MSGKAGQITGPRVAGNNRQACFFAEEDNLFYVDWLAEYAKVTGCLVHAFVLMTNHVHLLLTPEKAKSTGGPHETPS
jgi:putative transposase